MGNSIRRGASSWPGSLRIGLGILLALLVGSGASAVEIEMTVSGAAGTLCSGIVSGTQPCEVLSGQVIDVTWSLDQQTLLNGYDLEIRWNPNELSLLSSTPLHPDTGTAAPFVVEPSDPTDSQALAVIFTAENTTQLFRMSFEVSPRYGIHGADLSWLPASGLSPGTLVLENDTGAAIDFRTANDFSDIPAMPEWGRGLLGLLLLFAAGARLTLAAGRANPLGS
jgi:hypothetical protein